MAGASQKGAGLILVLMFFLLPVAPAISGAASERVYSMGAVFQFEVRLIHEIRSPILDYVREKSGLRLELEPSSTIPDFERGFGRSLFDFAYMNPYRLIVANREQGYLPLVRGPGRSLYGIIVVRMASPFSRVRDQEGKTIAFPAPNTLGAALMPRAEFATKFHLNYTPVNVRSHTSVYLNVLFNQAVAGGGVQATLNAQKPEAVRKLRVLHETARSAPHPVAVHPRVDEEDRAALAFTFLSLAEDQEGEKLVSKIPMVKVGPVSMKDYEPLKAMNLERY